MKKSLLLLLTLLLIGCGVQKRKYQKGFYVQWHKPVHESKERVARQKPAVEAFVPEKVTAAAIPAQAVSISPQDSCDILLFADGSEVPAKILEVSETEIRYIKCDNPTGPKYVSRKSDLFMIKYHDGKREVIKTEPERKRTDPVLVRKPRSREEVMASARSEAPRRRIHPLAPLSLIMGIGSLITLYVALILTAVYLTIPATVIALAFILGLAAVICGFQSIRRIREESDAFKGYGLAIPGIIMGGITVLILAFIFLLII